MEQAGGWILRHWLVGRQGRAWESQSLVQATDICFLASAPLFNPEDHAHVQACLLLREGLDLFSGPSQRAHLLRKPAVLLPKKSPGTRPRGSGTWAEIAAMKVEGIQGRGGLPSLVLGHLEEMWSPALVSSICGPQGRAGATLQVPYTALSTPLLAYL